MKAIKFSECVKNLVTDCIDKHDVEDLSLIWKLLRNILNEYTILKKNKIEY